MLNSIQSHIRVFFLIVLMLFYFSTASLAADLQKGIDAYDREDYTTAMEELRPLAEQGHAEAQYWLGSMYNLGRGVERDDSQAKKWYRLAMEGLRPLADQGHAKAQFFLGITYWFELDFRQSAKLLILSS